MPNLFIQEEHVNVTEGYRFGSSDVYEAFTDDRGELYRDLQREYGRCVSKVFRDQKDGPPKTVGWVFQKRAKYEDDPRQSYLHETWITLHEREPTRTIEYHYAAEDAKAQAQRPPEQTESAA